MKNHTKTGNGRKILIAYASRSGTTGEVAEAIGEALCNAGNVTETKPINTVRNLNGYDAVIIGSAINYDKWMPEATAFVEDNEGTLGKLPVAFFFTCLTLSRRNDKAMRQAQAYSDRLSSSFTQVKPVCIGRFAGVLDYTRFPLLPRLFLRSLFVLLGVKEGDHRDWSAITSWAKNVSPKFST
jgi:menaquinone-dependent protoporphyrinogen oxidase